MYFHSVGLWLSVILSSGDVNFVPRCAIDCRFSLLLTLYLVFRCFDAPRAHQMGFFWYLHSVGLCFLVVLSRVAIDCISLCALHFVFLFPRYVVLLRCFDVPRPRGSRAPIRRMRLTVFFKGKLPKHLWRSQTPKIGLMHGYQLSWT